MTKFGPEPAQTASHLSHFAARHVFGEMPQRADTSRVRGIHTRVRPLLLCCSPRALPTPGCWSGHTPQRLPHPSPPPGSLSPPPAPPERSHHGCRRYAVCPCCPAAEATAPHCAAASTAGTWPGRGHAFPCSNRRPAGVLLLPSPVCSVIEERISG